MENLKSLLSSLKEDNSKIVTLGIKTTAYPDGIMSFNDSFGNIPVEREIIAKKLLGDLPPKIKGIISFKRVTKRPRKMIYQIVR